MFPLYDSIKTARFPLLTWSIIAVNVVVFIQMVTSSDVESLILNYALIPSSVSFSNFETLLPFITSMFLHGGLMHILSNMWFLHIFGDNVEERLGIVNYIFLYFAAGIAGGVAQYSFYPESTIPMLGASAAVSGVLGAYLSYFPHHTIKSVVFLFFVITFANIPAGFYLVIWFVLQFFQGVQSIPTLGADIGGVAFLAHIGGFVTGFALSKILSPAKHQEYIEGEVVG